jgi:hypothetical protein
VGVFRGQDVEFFSFMGKNSNWDIPLILFYYLNHFCLNLTLFKNDCLKCNKLVKYRKIQNCINFNMEYHMSNAEIRKTLGCGR